MNESGHEEVSGEQKSTEEQPLRVRWTQKPLVRQVAVSSCIWTSYFQMGLFFGVCPVLVAQLRREALAAGTHDVDDEAASWISSTGTIFSIPCVLLLSLMGEYLGRRLSYLFICVVTFASFVVFYCSTSFNQLIFALILQGPLLGGSTNVCLMIASECVSPKYRGVFLAIKSASAYWAIWVANAIGTFFYWKYICIVGMTCAVYNTLFITVFPESPYWLASKGKFMKCREAHRWLRGTDAIAERDLECLINSEMERLRKIEDYRNWYKRLVFYIKKISATEFYQPVTLCMILLLMYNFSGKLVLSVYSIDILKKITDSESVAYTGMLILDGITLLGMYIGCVVSRYLKRRTLFFSTEFIAIFFLFVLSLYLFMIKRDLIKENVYLSISLLLAFSLSISCGPMVLITTVVSEIIPLELRTFAAILVCMAGSIFGAITLKLTPLIFSSFGVHGAFLYFAVTSLVSAMILLKCLPETKNKTLEEIESSFKETEKSRKPKELEPLSEFASTENHVNVSKSV